MRAIYSLVISGVIAALVGGCVLLQDEPKLDPIVGKWRNNNANGNCNDNRMEIDEFLKGRATFHFPVGTTCYWYKYDVWVTPKHNDYEIEFDYDDDCGEQDGDDGCSVKPDDFEYDCDLDDEELDCKDVETDIESDWKED